MSAPQEEFKTTPSEDTFVIEDLSERYDPEAQEKGTVHDQLPSVEEYKSNNAVTSSQVSTKKILVVAGVVTFVVLAIIGIAAIASKNKSDAAFYPNGRTQAIEEFLFTNQIASLPQLREPGSPYHLATAFIADGDMMQMELNQATSNRFVERFVLAMMYYHFKGSQWTYGLNFLSSEDHCKWYSDFETSKGKRVRQGVICDDEGRVKELNLAWNNLRGTHIPEEIRFFAKLETLHLYYNEIGGYFPDALREMPNLTGVGLMKMGLIGTLPNWIGELTQLTTLGLGDNHMHGDLPESIANLKNLRILGLDGNQGFTGNINKLKQLSNLEALYLEDNALTGNLLDFNWPKLQELDVSNNGLDQGVSIDLFNHPTLTVVDIHGNMMTGGFPDDIFENTNLEYFAAHNTGFSGTVPDRIAFLKALKHLDISFNGFTGTLPDTITQMTDLQYLATAGNHFTAQHMMDLSKLTNLKDLSMKDNNMIGKIPEWIGELTNLQLLDLDANELSGTIPSWIGMLQGLDYLLLNRNRLTGTIPTQIQNLQQLQLLLLDGNSLTGNANAVCNSDSVKPSVFIADCYPGVNGERPEIECRCCSQCCTDDDPTCNDKTWTSNEDLSWEHGYIREEYTFNLDNAPVAYAKEGDDQQTTDGL